MSNDFQYKDADPQSQPAERSTNPLDRRRFLVGAAAGAALLAMPRWAGAAENIFALRMPALRIRPHGF